MTAEQLASTDIEYGKVVWRQDMEALFALLALCTGNSPATDMFLSQRASKAGPDDSCGVC